MNVLIYSNVISWDMHAATTIEIIQNHLSKKDNVFLLTNKTDIISCLPHKKLNCRFCETQKKYIVSKLFNNKITSLEIEANKEHFIFPEFTKPEEILEFKYENMPIGELAMSQITDEFRQVFSNIKFINTRVKDLFKESIRLYHETCKIIEKEKIDIIYSWNGRRSTDGPTLYAGLKKNIQIFSYICGGKLNSYITQPTTTVHDLEFSKNRIEKFYREFYLSEDVGKKKYYVEEAEKFFKYMRYGGEPTWGYIYYKDLFDDKIKIQKKNNKKVMTIFTSSYYEFYALGESFRKKNNKEINHYVSLIKILSNKYLINNFDIRVRWHPNLSTAGNEEIGEIQKIIKKYGNDILHYSPFDKINSYNLLDISDIVVSFGSTVGIEATYYDKPSILWGSAYYEDTGGVYEVDSIEVLENMLKKDLKPKPKHLSLKFAYHERNRGENLYNFVKLDKNYKYYFKNFRVYKPNIYERFKEISKVILKSFGLLRYGRIFYNLLNKYFGFRKNKSFTPFDW